MDSRRNKNVPAQLLSTFRGLTLIVEDNDKLREELATTKQQIAELLSKLHEERKQNAIAKKSVDLLTAERSKWVREMRRSGFDV